MSQHQAATLKAAQEAFYPKVQGRLHAYIKETFEGRPAISCLWADPAKGVSKEVVFLGEEGFDALTVVRSTNSSMKASERVVSMLIEMYQSQTKSTLHQTVEF